MGGKVLFWASTLENSFPKEEGKNKKKSTNVWMGEFSRVYIPQDDLLPPVISFNSEECV